MGDVRPPPPGAYGVQGAEENIIFPENEVTKSRHARILLEGGIESFSSYIIRVAKCHGYDGYIRVKELGSWGKKFGRPK